MSLQAMEEEISHQALDLPRFAAHLRKAHLPKVKRSSLVFAGSGDSYAAAVFAQELSKGEAIASDPYELLTNIKRTRGKNLVIVSVSGRTKTNVELARKANGIATRTLAITAHPESPLARGCDETLPLEYRTAGTLTSGTISFATSLLACASLLGNLPTTIQLETTLGTANRWATNLKPVAKNSFVFAGSGLNYALSIYGAAKINEVLGVKAEAAYPEQLGHAILFSVDEERDLIVCLSNSRDKAREVYEFLRKNDFQTSLLAISGSDAVLRSLKIAIHLQKLPLAIAKRKRMAECAFLLERRKLKLSNKMIY
ncbi:MAG TPA: SIS domain-containing protein [Candidatus Sulfotelmatobacter sp.]|nr:SIS domain-containing protein [Candidatus Sulfotelmatobacter sp.]